MAGAALATIQRALRGYFIENETPSYAPVGATEGLYLFLIIY